MMAPKEWISQALELIEAIAEHERARGSIAALVDYEERLDVTDIVERWTLKHSARSLVESVPATEPEASSLRAEIASALNRCSAENGSDTPDFILAQFLVGCLAAFDSAVKERRDWYNPRIRAGAALSQDLSRYGYAPGQYIGKCFDCGQMMDLVDKRCRICKPCAESRRNEALTHQGATQTKGET